MRALPCRACGHDQYWRNVSTARRRICPTSDFGRRRFRDNRAAQRGTRNASDAMRAGVTTVDRYLCTCFYGEIGIVIAIRNTAQSPRRVRARTSWEAIERHFFHAVKIHGAGDFPIEQAFDADINRHRARFHHVCGKHAWLARAATSTSACRVTCANSMVFELHTITAAPHAISNSTAGMPTMLLRPTTTASRPSSLIPLCVPAATLRPTACRAPNRAACPPARRVCAS